MNQHSGARPITRISAEDDAVLRAAAAIDVAVARKLSGQNGIAQLIRAMRYAAERLSEDVFPGTGRFDAALHGRPTITDNTDNTRDSDGRERIANGVCESSECSAGSQPSCWPRLLNNALAGGA